MAATLPPAIQEEPITVAVADGVRLEARLGAAEAGAIGRAVICHPHPLQGGTMDNKVVTTATRAAAEAGLMTLRFNFRGVGESTGSYAGGVGERADVEAALKACERLLPEGRSLLIGFSFGSAVAARAVAAGSRVDQLLMIGPPLATIGVPPPPLPAEGLNVIVGDHDAFCPLAAAEAFVASYADPLARLFVVAEANHFFHGKLRQLAACLSQALG